MNRRIFFRLSLMTCVLFVYAGVIATAGADSINSPNITLNVDTNRSTGNGAGNVAVTVNTITIAEISLPEFSSGAGKSISLQARPGFQFDSTSNVSAQSATIGINGGALNAAAVLTPTGIANEVLTFNFTSGTNNAVQDIIRVSGIKVKILSAEGAAGPAQTTLEVTTSSVGGAFTAQGIVAANITRGAPDHLVFSIQPGNNQAGVNLLPQVKIVDFGGNVIPNSDRSITLSLSTNPGSATLNGNFELTSAAGIAEWDGADNLNITTASAGYVLQAAQDGTPLLTSDSVQSEPFEISAGDPGSISITTQPVTTTAGGDIILTATLLDEFGNPSSASGVSLTLDSAVNPGGWPLLVDSSLTKESVDGVVSWTADDHLRINKAIDDYRLSVSGLGTPAITDQFDVTPAAVSILRFLQQPTSITEGEVMNPPVTVELIDDFGNRTDSTGPVTLALPSDSTCGVLSGGSAEAVSGVATFNNVSVDAPCDNTTMTAVTDDIVGTVSDEFDIRAEDAFSVSIPSLTLKRNKLFQYSAQGTFAPSTETIDDPTKRGAALTVTGQTGEVVYNLPKKGWTKLGRRSFSFTGRKCELVTIKRNKIQAKCQSRTGSIELPETAVNVILAVGKGTQKFCGSCGGSELGNPDRVFKRRSCEAPEACP